MSGSENEAAGLDAASAIRMPALETGWVWQAVCASQDLIEAGDGIRFEVPGIAGPKAAFVIRYDGQAHAYLNQCQHVPIELDWQPGRFFDLGGLYLVCATHGASYDPESGECIAGPCQGRRLPSFETLEWNGQIWVAVRTEF